MGDDRPTAEEPATTTSATPPPDSAPAPTPVVSWGPPPGTTAPVHWAVVEAPVVPPPAGTVYAGVGIRFLAWLLDLIPVIILAVVLLGPVLGEFFSAMVDAIPGFRGSSAPSTPEMQAAMGEAMITAMAASAPGFLRASALLQLGGLLYIAGSWLAFSRSPAMALLGLHIVREEDGGRLGLGRVMVRYGGYLLSAVPLLIGFIWAIFDSRNQAWHDKLAGTVVVRRVQEQAVAPAIPADGGSDHVPPRKRPSIGGVAEAAWSTFRRSPLDLLASLAVVLIPTMVVLLPLIALYLVSSQDQALLGFRVLRESLNLGDSTNAEFFEYNRQLMALTAPTVQIGALAAFVGSITGAVLIGACAAAVDDERQIRPAAAVTRVVVERLPALLALGVVAGLLFAIQVVLLGLQAISAASASAATFDPNATALGAVLGAFVLAPIGLYLGAVWFLAVVCVVREGLGPAAAWRRAWQLSRGRMRWLIGVTIVIALGVYSILGPFGGLPLGLLAEDYIAGGRLPTALSVVTFGLGALLAAPLLGLTYVEAWRAARDEANARAAP